MVHLGKYKMIVRVLESRGKCEAHRPGDVYEWKASTLTREKPIKAPICPVAYGAIMPKVYAMEKNSHFPWHGDTFIVCCPDYLNLVVFQITRIPIKK